MILMIDNYDSFTYNIVQYMGELGRPPEVVRNDHVTLDELRKLDVEKLIISPGPGTPDEAGVSLEAVRIFADRKVPVFGVCLGHQCVGAAFGAKIVHAPNLMHGKVSRISHDGNGVFKDIPSPFTATRYHSLVIDPDTLPDELVVNATADQDVIMGVRHKSLPLYGVQFHPESVLTDHGHQMLRNFLESAQ